MRVTAVATELTELDFKELKNEVVLTVPPASLRQSAWQGVSDHSLTQISKQDVTPGVQTSACEKLPNNNEKAHLTPTSTRHRNRLQELDQQSKVSAHQCSLTLNPKRQH